MQKIKKFIKKGFLKIKDKKNGGTGRQHVIILMEGRYQKITIVVDVDIRIVLLKTKKDNYSS
jgi:hypothetical protein